MKVAILSDGIFPLTVGGIQRHTRQLAVNLALNNVEVRVYSSDLNGENFLEKLKIPTKALRNINFIHVEKTNHFSYPGHYIVEQFLFSKSIFKKFSKEEDNSDLIYAQSFTGWFFLKKKVHNTKGIRIISNFHGLEMYQKAADNISKLKTLMLRPFVKRNISISDVMFSNGGEQDKILKKLKVNNLEIIHLPIAIENNWLTNEMPKKNKIINFLFIGRFERRRGIEELHSALNNLIKTDIEFKFVFIGDLPKQIQINDRRIKYLGRVSDDQLKENLFNADILVNPSFAEGMSYAILEAMANGCAILASKVGSIPMNVDAKNGWLISPGRIHEIEDAIKNILLIPDEKIHKMKLESISRVRSKYLWNNVIGDYISKFEKIL